MGVLFGLVAAFSWGTGDVMQTVLARRIGVARALLVTQLAMLVLVGLILPIWPAAPAPTAATVAASAGLSLVNLAGTLLLLRAFAIGQLSLVAPITSGFAVFTALLALAAGERPAVQALAGAGLLCVGIAIVSRSGGARAAASDARGLAGLPRGVAEALGVVVCFGAFFFGLDFITPSLGALWPVFISRIVAVLAGFAMVMRAWSKDAPRPNVPWPLVVGAAALDNLAFVAFNLGIQAEFAAIVTPVASLYSAITAVFGWALLRERPAWMQWGGVLIILAGVSLVAL